MKDGYKTTEFWVTVVVKVLALRESDNIWYRLTNDEVNQCNPPTLSTYYHKDRDKYYLELLDDPDWLPVGYIPMPKSRAAWFFYHLIHGLVMRYPLHKVIGFALANTQSEINSMVASIHTKLKKEMAKR